jgi:branched-chain amino acid transport system ATP-binding protein
MTRLVVSELAKHFGGNRVLDRVSFSLRHGSLALVGPNGAGKTTLLNALAGVVRPSAGRIEFDDLDIAGLSTWKIARLGIVKTNQVVRPLHSLTVDEHLRVFTRGSDPVRRARALRATNLEEFREQTADQLPFGALKRLELAEAIVTGARLLLLDEPIGGLSRLEAEGIVETLRTLKAQGQAMIIVEHRLREILPFVDDVVALDRGRIIYDGPPSGFYADAAVRDAYIGRTDAGG